MLSGEGGGAALTVCFSVGCNDIGNVRSEKLRRKIRVTLSGIRNLGGVSVMCRILLRMRSGGE